MKIVLTVLLATTVITAAGPAANQEPLTYRFDEVRRSVLAGNEGHEIPVATGTLAKSGDHVRTGWFAYALISSQAHHAKFEVYSSSDVTLASGQPGVILSLNRGRLHAIFDKLTGSEPRIVKTPGALLAVRGTEYTVNVDAKGDTSVDVFEGLVEVSSPFRPEPLLVHPGESGVYGSRRPPSLVRTPPERQREPHHAPFGAGDHDGPAHGNPQDGRPHDGAGPGKPDPGMGHPPGNGPGGHGGMGQSPAPPPPPPPPPHH